MFVLLGVFVGVVYASTEVPSPDSISNAQTTILYYSDGRTEMARLGDENRTNVTLDRDLRARPERGAGRGEPQLLHRPGHQLHRHHPGGLEQRHRRLDPGWLDDHPAVRQERLPDGGPDVQPQVPGAVPGDQAGQQLHQGTDPRELPEHHLLRPRRLRHRGGGQHLLRCARLRAHRAAGRRPRRPDPEPIALRPRGERRGRAGPLGPRARRDGRGGLAHRRRARGVHVPGGAAQRRRLVAGHPERPRGPHRASARSTSCAARATPTSSSTPVACGSRRRWRRAGRTSRSDASPT